MIKTDEEFGYLNIEGENISISKTPLLELKKHLDKLDKKEKELLEKQNKYLSEILK